MALLERVSTLVRANLNDLIDKAEHPEKMIKQVVIDQKAQVENLKTALRQLEQKLTEAQAKADLLIAQHRRARAVGKASDAKLAIGDNSKAATFDRMKRKVAHSEAHSQAKSEIAGDNVEERLAALEKEDRIEQLLVELKAKRGA